MYVWLTQREIYENSYKILGFLKFDPSIFFPIITSKILVFLDQIVLITFNKFINICHSYKIQKISALQHSQYCQHSQQIIKPHHS